MRAVFALMIAAAAGLAGCDRLAGQGSQHSVQVWSGTLVQIDDEEISGSGIQLDVYRDPDQPADRELRYEISTGCIGIGRVSKEGEVLPYEVLRPCSVEDFERLSRVVGITGPGLPSLASGQGLTWTERSAELTSSLGKARFAAVR